MPTQNSLSLDIEQGAAQNEIFISYSRRDRDFAEMLSAALQQSGRDPWIDWSDIHPTEDWWMAIEAGIDSATTFLFVISPDSIDSQVCQKEIEYAVQNNKRLVPLLWREGFNLEAVHPAISRHNWLSFQESVDFEVAFQSLITALDTDLSYLRAHTRLLVRAKEWRHKLSDSSFLLRGNDLLAAEEWLEQSASKQPTPTRLQCDYINASRSDELDRQAVELRLRRMSPQQYRNRQALLSKVRNYWIKGVLENSLQDRLLMELGMELRAEAVNQPWYTTTNNFEQPPQPLPLGTSISTLFEQLGEGKTLLILGEPGAGKTTTLLKLTQDLLIQAEQEIDDRTPVVFNLASWTSYKQSIADWLIDELNGKYQIPKLIAKSLIETQQLFLLLDGLDEVKPENRDNCILALNDFQQQYGAEMVVCCRVQDYERLTNRLNFQQAVLVRSLTIAQIYDYLDGTGSALSGLRLLIERDSVLQELARSPLMLHIMALVYQGQSSDELPNLNLEDQRQYLFRAFIAQMLQRRSHTDCYSKPQVIHYLTWLSQKMLQDSRSVFLIENLQLTWLTNATQQRVYRMIVLAIVGMLCGVASGLLSRIMNYGLSDPWFNFLMGIIAGTITGSTVGFLPQVRSKWLFSTIATIVAGILFGILGQMTHCFLPLSMLLFALICGIVFFRLHDPVIESADAIKWSWSTGKQQFLTGMLWGLLAGGGLLISNWLLHTFDLRERLLSSILDEWDGSFLIKFLCKKISLVRPDIFLGLLALGIFVGLMIALILGFRKISEVESRTIPNHGVWKSVRNIGVLVSIGFSLSFVISFAFWLIYYATGHEASQVIWWMYYGKALSDGVLFSLNVACLVGILSFLAGGESSGLVALQHVILRILLWRNQNIPWNYAKFLDYAAKRILLKKVGGGYIFIHRSLLEHFAQMQDELH
ncbi:TIR domain-containing protein [filamentous cyanobacterium LEGE 11480]|uniref:TIR domain-containing protein n=1 Tax=Romeriopsis navalis LEGE 11480 TaxID=2777977 RepID=A0A928VSL3_9CYAN|nr:TIR domain-containing protein [Romeriopsis navalis]MBE9032997.1 TIR domain-containing protein [Romeriopsis navalis LEGE 11480]